MAQTFLSQLEWRFAAKQFDPGKSVSEENVGKIVEAIRMAPTSFGLQPFQVIVVTDPAMRTRLREAAWNQSQVTDASHLLVFCARTDVAEHIDRYIDQMAGGDEAVKATMTGFKEMMSGFTSGMDAAMQLAWTARQAYIRLGFALAACAELGVDSCPMEGFDRAAYDTALGLPEYLKSVALLPIGYRAAGPDHPKFRLPLEAVVRKA